MASFDPHDPNADPAIPIDTPTAVNGQVAIVDDGPAWPAMYAREAMGSTAVPGLPAKPCLGILPVVADAGDEMSYATDLEAAGDVLRIREPDRHEHRVFKGLEINLNLHVWSKGSPEVDRHLAFRDWLRTHEADRGLYAATRRELAARRWTSMQEYADAKNTVGAEIQGRIEASR